MIAVDNLRVLVVDDAKSSLMFVGQLLEAYGCQFITLESDPEKAIDLVKKAQDDRPFDLIITDINMPKIDGFQLLKLLAETEYSGAVAILSDMDKRVLNSAESLALKHGLIVSSSMSKPVNSKALKATLKRACLVVNEVRKRHLSFVKDYTEDEIRSILYTPGMLVPYYQPIVNADSGKVESLEVLSRLIRTGETDAASAGELIPHIEKHQLTSVLLNVLFRQVLRDAAVLFEQFDDGLKLSFNLSPNDLAEVGLPDKLEKLISTYKYQPSQFIFEITEGLPLHTPEQVENLSRLRLKGFGVALDDFGVGYTNIYQLKELPFTEVKLDRSLVHNIAENKIHQIITTSILEVLKEMNIEMVVEGVELDEDIQFFKQAKNKVLLQGYVISKPKSLDAILHWHKVWNRLVG